MSQRIFFERPEAGVGWYARYESPTRRLSGWDATKASAVADLLTAAKSASGDCDDAEEEDEAFIAIVAFARKNGFMVEP